MAQLIVRNLEEEVRDKLRKLAQAHGHSMEEEVRDILRAAVVGINTAESGLGTRISSRFADFHTDQEFDIPEWRGLQRRSAPGSAQ